MVEQLPPKIPQLSLPDKLRTRKSMRRVKDAFSGGAEHLWLMTDEPDKLCHDAADEIERLMHELWELEIRFKMTPNSHGDLPDLGEGWRQWDWD